MRFFTYFSVLPFAFSLMSVGVAKAALPGPTSTVSCTPIGQPTFYASTYCHQGDVTASISEYPDVTLQATADYSQGASADLDYYFEVTGGSYGDAVPILIDTSLVTSGGVVKGGFASITINGNQVAVACTNICGSDISFTGPISLTAYSGEAEYIDLYVQVDGQAGRAGTAYASIDPYIHVDPSFAQADDYAVIVSPGIGNSPAGAGVPEPTTWAMILIGFGGLGGILRRRLRIAVI